MPRFVRAGAPASFDVELDPPADAASVRWSLLDSTGAIVAGLANQALTNPEEAYAVTIEVEPAGHSKTLTTENRFLSVAWVAGGAARQKLLPYIVIDWMPITVEPTEVRNLWGLNDAELADADIDLVGAAVLLQDELGPAFLPQLSAGGAAAVRAQRLVALKAALELSPSIMLRAAQAMSSNNVGFRRFSRLRLDAVLAGIRTEYDKLAAAFLGDTPPPVIFTLTNPTPDPVTGA